MNNYYSYIKTSDTYLDEADHATYKGITIKTISLLLVTVIVGVLTAIFLPNILNSAAAEQFVIALIAAAFISFIAVIVGRISDRAARVCSMIYALCEGLLLGTVTAFVNAYYPGAGTLAISATVIIFAVMLVLYAFGFIRNGSMMRMIIFGLILSILALLVFDIVYIIATGTQNYGMYLFIQGLFLVYGVVTLTFNFAEAEAVVKMGASKDAEWSVALGMEVSIIYIYIYILRIIVLLSSRSR